MNPDDTERPDDGHHDNGWDITDYELTVSEDVTLYFYEQDVLRLS